MKCKHCNSNLDAKDKFCKACGRAANLENEQFDIEKIRKNLKNTGNSIVAMGWLTIIANVALYFWQSVDPSYAESGLPLSDLTSTTLMVSIAAIYIVLGKRISEGADSSIARYLKILIVLSIIVTLIVSLSGGRVGLLVILVIIYMFSSLRQVGKALKVEAFRETQTRPKHTLDKKGWIIFALVAVIFTFIALFYDLSSQEPMTYPEFESQNTPNIVSDDSYSYSKEELISASIESFEDEFILPYQVDEVTTLTKVSQEREAIRYHYVISGLDSATISSAELKENLTPSVCDNEDTKFFLDQDINVEYSYTVEETGKKYFVSISNDDCELGYNYQNSYR